MEAQLASGISLTWQGCYVTGTALALFGERCGANRDQFNYQGLFAYNKTTGQLYRNCVTLRSATAAVNVPALFGDCGVAPTAFSGIPAAACMETASQWRACWQASVLVACCCLAVQCSRLTRCRFLSPPPTCTCRVCMCCCQ